MLPLPAAAVGFEHARGAPPYGVHAKHLGAAALAKDFIGGARRIRAIRRGRRRRRVRRFRHRKNYIPRLYGSRGWRIGRKLRIDSQQMSAYGQFWSDVYTL